MTKMLLLLGFAVVAACSPGSDVPAQAPINSPNPPVTLSPTFGGRLHAPADLQVAQFDTVRDARGLAVAPDGSIYVSQPGHGQITRLVDANHDGVVEQRSVVLQRLNQPHGMAFRGGWFYVANTDATVRYRLDANGLPSGSPETIATYSWGGGHSTRSIVFGTDGALYISVGSSCNLCEERNPDRAAVSRVAADGGPIRVYSRGLRNAVGIALNPVTGKIWVSQHERDNIRPNHQDLPPEEINILEDGAHFGWPYCYAVRVPNPEYGDPAKCAPTAPPALMMQAHSAPLGMSFLDKAAQLPAPYRGDLLLAFHGSWNRDIPTGAKVVRVRIANGLPVSYEDFITGWQDPSGNRWGRPVDVAVAADGSVLISDDDGGVIWRVTPR